MSDNRLAQTASASQIIDCILTGLKLDAENNVQRSALTEACDWRLYIKPNNFRKTTSGNWIEVYDGYNWSPVLPQTMQWWLKAENLPADALKAVQS